MARDILIGPDRCAERSGKIPEFFCEGPSQKQKWLIIFLAILPNQRSFLGQRESCTRADANAVLKDNQSRTPTIDLQLACGLTTLGEEGS